VSGAAILPAGIASDEAFGTTTVSIGIQPSGIASAEAFGVPTISVGILPAGIASAEAFGVPSVGIGILPSGIASAEAFGDATVNTVSGLNIIPGGIASAEAFGTLTVTATAPSSGFTGTPITQASTWCGTRVTGLSLDAGAVGTIGMLGDTGAAVQLPSVFPATPDNPAMTLSDLIEVRIQQSQTGHEASHIAVDKSEIPFRITLTNTDGADSGELEIHVQYHHSMHR
jgi:hypothetical protein